jgi:hypothetical protein
VSEANLRTSRRQIVRQDRKVTGPNQKRHARHLVKQKRLSRRMAACARETFRSKSLLACTSRHMRERDRRQQASGVKATNLKRFQFRRRCEAAHTVVRMQPKLECARRRSIDTEFRRVVTRTQADRNAESVDLATSRRGASANRRTLAAATRGENSCK